VAVLGGAVVATCLILAPVAFHRLLFRKRQRLLLVESANRLALAGLGTLMVTLAAMVLLVVDVVLGRSWAAATGGLTLLLFVALWVAVPVSLARLGRFPRNPSPDAPAACGRPRRRRPPN
jgi:hypothetical protein